MSFFKLDNVVNWVNKTVNDVQSNVNTAVSSISKNLHEDLDKLQTGQNPQVTCLSFPYAAGNHVHQLQAPPAAPLAVRVKYSLSAEHDSFSGTSCEQFSVVL